MMFTFSRTSLSPRARDMTQKTTKGLGHTAGMAPFCRTRSETRSITDGLPELLGVFSFRMQAHGNDTAVEGGKVGGDTKIHGWRQSKVFATRQTDLFAASGPGLAWRKFQVGQEEQGEHIVNAIEDQVVTSKHDRDSRRARASERALCRDTRRWEYLSSMLSWRNLAFAKLLKVYTDTPALHRLEQWNSLEAWRFWDWEIPKKAILACLWVQVNLLFLSCHGEKTCVHTYTPNAHGDVFFARSFFLLLITFSTIQPLRYHDWRCWCKPRICNRTASPRSYWETNDQVETRRSNTHCYVKPQTSLNRTVCCSKRNTRVRRTLYMMSNPKHVKLLLHLLFMC